jgi:hypothetical protein
MDVVSPKRSVATDLTTISSDLYGRCLIIVPGWYFLSRWWIIQSSLLTA